MKILGIIGSAVLVSALGITTPVYAQQAQRAGHGDHDQQKQSKDRHGKQVKQNDRRQRQQAQQHERQGTWQQHRARSWTSEHRSWRDRGGYQGYRIPDDRYRRYFGSRHQFRINSRPFRVSGGNPSFQYRGYWFNIVDPWPENWANNWYDTDNVYLTYGDDGYYLHNRSHPNVGIAVHISL